jgi:polar amino acid transport system permease protein
MPAPFDLLPPLLTGALVTVGLAIGGLLGAVLVSFAAGLARLSSRSIVRALANVFVEIFRGTSLLVQLFILFYILPLAGVTLGPVATGILGLSLNWGAYGSEIVRGAIHNVEPGQRDAATAMNMNWGIAMRVVILPQAVVAMLPSFGNLALELLKATSLTSLITITELSLSGRVLVQTTHRPTEVFTLVLLIYFVLAFPITRLVTWLERWSARGLATGRPS